MNLWGTLLAWTVGHLAGAGALVPPPSGVAAEGLRPPGPAEAAPGPAEVAVRGPSGAAPATSARTGAVQGEPGFKPNILIILLDDVGTDQFRRGPLLQAGAAFVIEKGATWSVSTVSALIPLANPTNALVAGDQFGSVAIHGDTIAVGARRWDDPATGCPSANGCDEGAVYVFERRSNGAWIQIQLVVAQDPSTGLNDSNFANEFGFAVALSREFLVVGVPGKDLGCGSIAVEPNCDSGAVYEYDRDSAPGSGPFTIRARLTAAGTILPGSSGAPFLNRPTAFERFGYSVAVSGSRIVVGAPGRLIFEPDESTLNTGAVYVFERNPETVWRRTRFITEFDVMPGAPSAEGGSFFGASVAASENVIAIGSPFATANGELLSGRAYSFYQLPEFDRDNAAFQVAEHVPFCFGDGGVQMGCTDCPCMNNAALNTNGGCLNPEGKSARLFASGRASVLEDTLRFEVMGATMGTFGVLIGSTTQLPLAGGSCPPGSGLAPAA